MKDKNGSARRERADLRRQSLGRVVVRAALAALITVGGSVALKGMLGSDGGTSEDLVPVAAPAASPMPEASASGSVDSAGLAAGWRRLQFGDVSVAMPDGWGAATLVDGELRLDGLDLDQSLASQVKSPLEQYVDVTLIDRSTTESWLEHAVTWVDIYSAGEELGRTEGELVDFLRGWAHEDTLEPTFAAFDHPVAPAAVMGYRYESDGSTFLHRDYLLGFSPATIVADVGTDPRNPEADFATAEAIIGTIRVAAPGEGA